MNILFVNNNKYDVRDGLIAAINLLIEEGFVIDNYNMAKDLAPKDLSKYNIILGHGAFGSPVDNFCKDLPNKKALCLAGNAVFPTKKDVDCYDIIFYETDFVYNNLLKKYDNKKGI